MARDGDLKSRAKAIVSHVGELLREEHFVKRGNTYAYDNGHVIQMLDVQYSRWNDVREISFTLNCGVFVRGVAAAFRDAADPPKPQIADCCVSARIGLLTDGGLDIWWKVSAEAGASHDESTSTEIATIVKRVALPFLRRFPDETSVAMFLSQPPAAPDRYVEPRAEGLRFAYAAIAWNAAGRRDECQRCFDEAVSRSKQTPLAATIGAFEKRFKCRD